MASLAALEHRCPDHIEAADWQHAVEDGRRFLIQWGERATALGWAGPDVFGLPPVPSNPHPSWQRLARVDQLGLVWLTHGRRVTSITAESATMATPRGGSVAFYRLRARRRLRSASPQAHSLTDDNVDNVDDERPPTTTEPPCPAKPVTRLTWFACCGSAQAAFLIGRGISPQPGLGKAMAWVLVTPDGRVWMSSRPKRKPSPWRVRP
jgi:hypothetical protein